MTSIIAAVVKATVGLLVNKGRDKAAEKLKDGDVTDQKFRGLIVREIDDIKSKLDGLARKDLLASISFFKEGIELLYEMFQKAKSRREYGAVPSRAAAGTANAETISLTNKMRMLEITGLGESATKALTNAKDRFKDARREATKAFSNEALELSDRVLAMQYRVMSTILETVDDPEEALTACRVCIEELHQLSAVKECFSVELKKGLRARFSKDERRKIISTVCHVNRVIYDVMLMAGFGRKELSTNNWPCVDTVEKKVNPLRDARIVEVLQKQGMEHFCVPPPWSFGQEDDEEHKLKNPYGIATNAKGQFLIADNADTAVKVFDRSGMFLLSFKPYTDDADKKLDILDIAADVNTNICVLVELKKPGAEEYDWEVQVCETTGDLLHNFPVSRGIWGRLTVSNSKVVVLRVSNEVKHVVDVYKHDGGYVRSFGEGILESADDIAADNDGAVMVLDSSVSCVHVFAVDGTQLSTFNINAKGYYYRMTCHPAGEHVVVAINERGTGRLRVLIYTRDCEFVRSIVLDEEKIVWLVGIAVTMEGHIAVAVRDMHENDKVIVL